MLGKTNFLSRSYLDLLRDNPSHFFWPATMYVAALINCVSCRYTLSPKLYLSLLQVWCSFYFPPTGLCHVAIYISPDPELLGILIEYAPWPHSFHTIYINSVGPHCCKFAGYGSAYFTYLRRNDIPSWSVLHSSFQVHSCSGRPHFVKTPCFANSIALAFLWSSCAPYFRLNHNAPTAEALAYCWNVTFTRLVQCLYWLLLKHWIIVF